jgi:hypothetical protein
MSESFSALRGALTTHADRELPPLDIRNYPPGGGELDAQLSHCHGPYLRCIIANSRDGDRKWYVLLFEPREYRSGELLWLISNYCFLARSKGSRYSHQAFFFSF